MLKSAGLLTIATAGTIIRVTTTPTFVHSVRFTAAIANTGRIIVGLATLVTSTGVGHLGTVGIPPATGQHPYVEFTIENAPNGINLADLYVDATVNGEKVIVSYTEQ